MYAFGIIGSCFFIALIVFLFANRVSLFVIQGESMSPSLNHGDIVLLKQEAAISHGQVIFFNRPDNWEIGNKEITTLVKRVVAIPGDVFSYNGTHFLINSEVVSKAPTDCKAPIGYQTRLNDKQVLVFGDNAESSIDSRHMFCLGRISDIYVPRQSVVDYGNIVTKF